MVQKYGKKLKWFGQEQSSFELESEGRLLPVDNADLLGRVAHGQRDRVPFHNCPTIGRVQLVRGQTFIKLL